MTLMCYDGHTDPLNINPIDIAYIESIVNIPQQTKNEKKNDKTANVA